MKKGIILFVAIFALSGCYDERENNQNHNNGNNNNSNNANGNNNNTNDNGNNNSNSGNGNNSSNDGSGHNNNNNNNGHNEIETFGVSGNIQVELEKYNGVIDDMSIDIVGGSDDMYEFDFDYIEKQVELNKKMPNFNGSNLRITQDMYNDINNAFNEANK